MITRVSSTSDTGLFKGSQSSQPSPALLGQQAALVAWYSAAVRRPKTMLLGVAAVLLASAFGWPRFAFDASSDTLVAEGDAAYAFYIDLGERFPIDDFVVEPGGTLIVGANDHLFRYESER